MPVYNIKCKVSISKAQIATENAQIAVLLLWASRILESYENRLSQQITVSLLRNICRRTFSYYCFTYIWL